MSEHENWEVIKSNTYELSIGRNRSGAKLFVGMRRNIASAFHQEVRSCRGWDGILIIRRARDKSTINKIAIVALNLLKLVALECQRPSYYGS